MSIWKKATELNENFVQITLTNVRGGAPQDIGAKCLVTKDGFRLELLEVEKLR